MTKIYNATCLIVLAVLMLTSSCTKNSDLKETQHDWTLKIKDPQVTLLVFDNYLFQLSSDNTFLSNESFDWTSSNENVATVDDKGRCTGKAPGTARIKATARTNGFLVFGIAAGTSIESTVTVKSRD